MYVLKYEDKNKKSDFLTLSEFTSSTIAIPKSFYNSNILIKGSVKTGKTQKIMLPMFFKCEQTEINKKIYFTANCNLLDLKGYSYKYYTIDSKFKETQIKEIYHNLKNNLNVIIGYDTNNNKKKNQNFTLATNELFKVLNNHFKMSYFFDEFQKLPKVELVLSDLNKDKHLFFIAVQYSAQLLQLGYTQEEINFIKEHTNAIDTEKQYC